MGLDKPASETTGEMEKLCTSKRLFFETFLESLLCMLDMLSFIEEIHVGQDTHNLWETMHLKNVQHFKCFLNDGKKGTIECHSNIGINREHETNEETIHRISSKH